MLHTCERANLAERLLSPALSSVPNGGEGDGGPGADCTSFHKDCSVGLIEFFHPPRQPVPTCVIFNPTARGDKARHFREHLARLAPDCVFKPTDCAGAAMRLASEAVAEGFDTVVAAGGDGTVNEVVTGIARAPDGLRRARLAILPLGTINVIARELRIPLALKSAWNVVATGSERVVDLAEMEFAGAHGRERRSVVQLAGAGLDARAIELVSWSLKKKFGPLAYFWAGVRAMRERHPAITVSRGGAANSGIAEVNASQRAELVLIGSGQFYGGSLRVFPQARMDDGQFDLCLIERVTWLALLRFVWGMATGRLERQTGFSHWQSAGFTMASEERVPLEIEGDAVGHLPATCRVLPRALRILAPASAAR